jgi:two-component system sensor histidine kinase KdpD
LLTSISHDLKTPLAAILGAAGTLKRYGSGLAIEERDDLLATVVDEAERLNRFIANLLDMTRLESGAIKPNAAPHDLSDIIGAALHRARKVLDGHAVAVDVAADLPMTTLDPILFEQVLFNLLDNAAKYSPATSKIEIRARHDQSVVLVHVVDEGSGIPPDELATIFEKFHRSNKGDHVRAGTGLGLSICRGFIEAMGGTITASNRPDRPGAVFTMTLPYSKLPPDLEPDA